jgi:hypothetical protein
LKVLHITSIIAIILWDYLCFIYITPQASFTTETLNLCLAKAAKIARKTNFENFADPALPALGRVAAPRDADLNPAILEIDIQLRIC